MRIQFSNCFQMIDWLKLVTAIKKAPRSLWRYLREVSGEDDYTRYRAHSLARGENAMTAQQFYQQQQQRKYSRPNRCC